MEPVLGDNQVHIWPADRNDNRFHPEAVQLQYAVDDLPTKRDRFKMFINAKSTWNDCHRPHLPTRRFSCLDLAMWNTRVGRAGLLMLLEKFENMPKLLLAMLLTPTAILQQSSSGHANDTECSFNTVLKSSSGGMSSPYLSQAPPSPPESPSEATVDVYALSAGHFSLPERFFVHPASQTARRTVPSLCFLITHRDQESGKITRIVFDLGLRRDLNRYSPPIQKHAETRQPMTTLPDVTASLAAGGLTPDDIHYVIFSHVHWDHVGEPRDFPKSTFVIGSGASALLQGQGSLRGSHSFFESDLLPAERMIELSNPYEDIEEEAKKQSLESDGPDFVQEWKAHGNLPRVLDIFHDGSLLIVDAPGHLPGHINLLARTSPTSRVYLAGDACHDRRIMRNERQIGEWLDDHGHICCIHADKKLAEQTIERIQQLEMKGVEVIFAHDFEWEEDPANRSRFFGSS